MTKAITVHRGTADDLLAYLAVMQRSAELAYRHPEIDHYRLFAAEHYFYPTTLAAWRSKLLDQSAGYWWVAHPAAEPAQIIGGIQLIKGRRLEGGGFYVEPAWQGQGVGRALAAQRQKFIDGPLYFEVFSHAADVIAGHERRGARPTGRRRLIHWDSWPDGINLEALEYVYEPTR